MKTVFKIAGLLLSLIILVIVYSMITEIHTIEEFIEGNEYNDCKTKVKQKVQQILNMPIATKDSKGSRPSAQDMINKIKQIQTDVENGTGDFEGNTYRCFPGEIRMYVDLRLDPNETLQLIQKELTKKE
jgi:hypothetical protein